MGKPITAVLPYLDSPQWHAMFEIFQKSEHIEQIILLHNESQLIDIKGVCAIKTNEIFSSTTIQQVIQHIHTDFFLFLFPSTIISFGQRFFQRLLQTAYASRPGVIYADYFDGDEGTVTLHPLLDYHAGSVRDGFDFGPFLFIALSAAQSALTSRETVFDLHYAGFYDLRLRLSVVSTLYHIPEPLCTKHDNRLIAHAENHFDYVNPAHRTVQKEYEHVFLEHLKSINAYLKPDFSTIPSLDATTYPVDMTVVIPVLNRGHTIGDALASICTQKCSFSFNIIVVDNHSTDTTPEVIQSFVTKNPFILHHIPKRHDLGIGGCWNEAVFSDWCGKYTVQLDSDDIYSDEFVLQRIYDAFNEDDFAMIIGSYTIVDFKRNVLPPGLIDHREWTWDNGRNNALRINGLGAPRAFRTSIIRSVGFPNVSYGEDYAAVLGISRFYKIGRIYDSLYFCRRWEGNTDSTLTLEKSNRNDRYKDNLRGFEIAARQYMNTKAQLQ